MKTIPGKVMKVPVTNLHETRVVIKAVEVDWMVEDQASEASVDETEEQKVALQPV